MAHERSETDTASRVAAERVTEIRAQPRSPAMQVAAGTWRSISADNVSLLAAGVAFYSLLAVFPGLAFVIAMFGLLADPAQVQQQLATVHGVLPEEAWNAIDGQVVTLVSQTHTSLSIATAVSLALALLNARLAASAMMGALNIIYKRPETRSFLRTNSIAFMFTVGALALLSFSIVAVVAVPQVFVDLGFPQTAHSFAQGFRWPALALLMAAGLVVTYRFGPNRDGAKWYWMTLGSLIATLLWLIGSSAFSWYVSQFNSYDRLYGSFGAVVILLYWFWVTAYAALMGAEIDMQIHTAVDRRT